MELNEEKLHEFVGKMLGDFGAAVSIATALVGDKLGLYKSMMDSGPVDSHELAKNTGTAERNIREWLAAQASSGFVDYDEATGKFSLSPEQAMVFAMEESPVFLAGGFSVIASSYRDEDKLVEAFKSGKGIAWGDFHDSLFCGVARFFRPQYVNHLVSTWIPAIDGLQARMTDGAKVADVGCGQGESTVLMAKAFPKSSFVGYDLHDKSIQEAKKLAGQEGVADRVTFEVATAQDFIGKDFDAAMVFDCLHDMGDPAGAAKQIHGALKPDGVWMIVEPMANDELKDNMNPVSRIYYSASTMICTPASLSQDVGLALGAQAGEARLREVVTSGGFTQFKRATENPFNMILEARP